jgi:hypothetical protein
MRLEKTFGKKAKTSQYPLSGSEDQMRQGQFCFGGVNDPR